MNPRKAVTLCLVVLAFIFAPSVLVATEEEVDDTLVLQALRSAGLPDQPQVVIGGTMCFNADSLQGTHCHLVVSMSTYVHSSNAGYGPVLTLNFASTTYIWYWSVGDQRLYNGKNDVTWFKFYPKND